MKMFKYNYTYGWVVICMTLDKIVTTNLKEMRGWSREKTKFLTLFT
jgi:hypothetical protein